MVSSSGPFTAVLESGILRVGNDLVERTFTWNGGNLIPRTLTDKKRNVTWHLAGDEPGFLLPGLEPAGAGSFTARSFAGDGARAPCGGAVVVCRLGPVEVKRVFRVYPGVPAVACDVFLRGPSSAAWESPPDLHACTIFPAGEEPSGASWTGFHAVRDPARGYFLVYREYTDRPEGKLAFHGLAGKSITCRLLLGEGGDFTVEVPDTGGISFRLPRPPPSPSMRTRRNKGGPESNPTVLRQAGRQVHRTGSRSECNSVSTP